MTFQDKQTYRPESRRARRAAFFSHGFMALVLWIAAMPFGHAANTCTNNVFANYTSPTQALYPGRNLGTSNSSKLGELGVTYAFSGCQFTGQPDEKVVIQNGFSGFVKLQNDNFDLLKGLQISYYGLACSTCANNPLENLKFVVTRTITGTGCQLTNEFEDSNIPSMKTKFSKDCTGFVVAMKVEIVQTDSMLKSKSAYNITNVDFITAGLQFFQSNGYTVLSQAIIPASGNVKITPSPQCTFAIKNTSVALANLHPDNVNPLDKNSLLNPKSFSLQLMSCNNADKRPVNLTWAFNKPSETNDRLSNTLADGSKGVHVVIQAKAGQKMVVGTNTPYTDLTVKNLETYRALNSEANTNLNFTAAYVANGETPGPGPFVSSATVTLGYD